MCHRTPPRSRMGPSRRGPRPVAGRVDAAFGVMLSLVGLALASGYVVLGGAVAAIGVPLWIGLGERGVLPALDRGGAEPRAEKAAVGLGVGLLALAVVVFVLLRPDVGGRIPRAWAAALPAVLLALPTSLGALLWGQRRFHLYAVLLLVGGVLVVLAEAEPGWGVLFAGVGATLLGVLRGALLPL